MFPGLVTSYLYYPEKPSDKLVKDFGIYALPVFLLGKEAQKEKEKKSQQKQAEEAKKREAEVRALEQKEQEARDLQAKGEQRKKLILKTLSHYA